MASTSLPLDLEPQKTAFFLDCDGTLAQIVQEPLKAQISPEVLGQIDLLAKATGGALAIVSGRSIEQLDRLLSPLKLPLAGVHGVERRDATGQLHAPFSGGVPTDIVTRLREFAGSHRGLIAEIKPGAVAVHYRLRPELGPLALEMAATEVQKAPQLRVMRGKMVVEVAASDRTKGDAILDFMQEPPFAGRSPVFAGDDITDEDGFAAVARLSGIGIRIGTGATLASHSVADIKEFHDWLGELCGRWRGDVGA